MRIYETNFIINPQTDDATIDNRVAAVSGIITQNGGKIICDDHMGTRRLAYPIKGLTQGYYGAFIFEAPVVVLPLLDRHYKQDESYIRFLTVEFEGNLAELIERSSPPAASATPKWASSRPRESIPWVRCWTAPGS